MATRLFFSIVPILLAAILCASSVHADPAAENTAPAVTAQQQEPIPFKPEGTTVASSSNIGIVTLAIGIMAVLLFAFRSKLTSKVAGGVSKTITVLDRKLLQGGSQLYHITVDGQPLVLVMGPQGIAMQLLPVASDRAVTPQ